MVWHVWRVRCESSSYVLVFVLLRSDSWLLRYAMLVCFLLKFLVSGAQSLLNGNASFFRQYSCGSLTMDVVFIYCLKEITTFSPQKKIYSHSKSQKLKKNNRTCIFQKKNKLLGITNLIKNIFSFITFHIVVVYYGCNLLHFFNIFIFSFISLTF